MHFCWKTNQSAVFQRIKMRPVVTDSLAVCGAPETLVQRGDENSAARRVLRASLPLPSSPVTNYLCYFTRPPSQQNSGVCCSDTSCLPTIPDGVCDAQVLPCRRGSACWSGSPAALAASRRAGRWLCGPTRTAPGNKMNEWRLKCVETTVKMMHCFL